MHNAIAELRADVGLTQAALAARLGVSRQTVVAVERDRHDPSLPLAFAIARCFGLPIEEIFYADH